MKRENQNLNPPISDTNKQYSLVDTEITCKIAALELYSGKKELPQVCMGSGPLYFGDLKFLVMQAWELSKMHEE